MILLMYIGLELKFSVNINSKLQVAGEEAHPWIYFKTSQVVENFFSFWRFLEDRENSIKVSFSRKIGFRK